MELIFLVEWTSIDIRTVTPLESTFSSYPIFEIPLKDITFPLLYALTLETVVLETSHVVNSLGEKLTVVRISRVVAELSIVV